MVCEPGANCNASLSVSALSFDKVPVMWTGQKIIIAVKDVVWFHTFKKYFHYIHLNIKIRFINI